MHQQQLRKNKNAKAKYIVWFNPYFSKSVSTNVAKTFHQLLAAKHFLEATNFTKFLTEMQLKSATVA